MISVAATRSPVFDLQSISGVAEGGAAECSFDVHLRLTLDGCTQREGAGHVEVPGGANTDDRRVVALDGIGPVKIGLHRLNLVQPAAAGDGKGCDHRVRQQIRDDPVDDGPAAQSSGGRPMANGPVPEPCATTLPTR